MKRINSRCWEYKGFTILKENIYPEFPYTVYDDEGFSLEAFRNSDDCKKFIDEIYKEIESHEEDKFKMLGI